MLCVIREIVFSEVLVLPMHAKMTILSLVTRSSFLSIYRYTGFVEVIENLESHGILQFHFLGLVSPEI